MAASASEISSSIHDPRPCNLDNAESRCLQARVAEDAVAVINTSFHYHTSQCAVQLLRLAARIAP